jgi:hypothetical protein
MKAKSGKVLFIRTLGVVAIREEFAHLILFSSYTFNSRTWMAHITLLLAESI